MFRTIRLMKRPPGMTPLAFPDYHEPKHNVLGAEAAQGHALSYSRSYLHPMTPGDPAPFHDVLMQRAFPQRPAFVRCTGAVANDAELSRRFVEDELNLVDRAATAAYLAEDSFSS